MQSIVLRPRKATEIVDAAIEVYRRNPIHFLLLTSVVHVPWLIVQIMFAAGRNETEVLSMSILVSAGTLVTYFLMSGLIVHLASELYLGRETDAFETLRRIRRKLPVVFVASLLQSLAIGVALILFLFPAVWVTALMFAVIPAIVIENRSIPDAFARSRALSQDLKMHILSALGLVMLIRFVVQVSVALLVVAIPNPPLRYVVAAAASIVIYPLIGIAEALVYYDARIRKEGFDIEMMAGQGAQSIPAPA